MIYLQNLYKLQMAPVLCDVWQIEYHTDDKADDKAI